MAIKERLIQLTLKARDLFSGEVQRSSEALAELRAENGRLQRSLQDDTRTRQMVRTLRDTQDATRDLERSFRDAQSTVDDLTREIGENENATAGQRIALREARQAAEAASRALRSNQTQVRNLSTALTAAGVDIRSLNTEEQRLSESVDQGKASLAENRAELRRVAAAEAEASKAAEEHRSRVEAVRSAMVGGVRQAVAYAAAFVGINAAFGLIRRGIDAVKGGILAMLQTGDEFEGLQTRLTALMGSVEGGKQATEWITQFAKDTPLQLSEVTDAFALMKAYGLDPMDGTFKALEDQSEKLGGGMERLSGIATAVGQAWAKQKLQTEEVLQLVERGVPVWDMLSKVTGKNVGQLQDLASKGKLGRDVIKALLDEMARSSAGAAAANMSRLTGLVSNLEDTAANFLNRIAKSGALEYVKGRLQALGGAIAQMDQDGRLDALASSLSTAFVEGAKGVEDFIRKLADVDYKKLIDDGTAWLSSFKSHVDDATAVVDQVVTAGRFVTATLSTVWNGFSLLVSSTAATLAKGMQLTVGSLALGAGQIAGFFGGTELQGKAERLYEFLGDLSTGYVEQAKTDAAQIAAAWESGTQKAADAAGQQTEVVTEHFENLKTSAQDASVQAVQAVTSLQNALDQISTATSVDQLTKLQEEMRKAYQAGNLSQQEYANGAGVLNAKLKELQKAASGAALGISDLSDGLETLKDVQNAIASAKTSADISNIRTALNKLYNDGKIKADEFNRSQKELSEKIAEMKAAGVTGAQGMDAFAESTDKATQSLEEQRKAIGEAMEAERKSVGFVKEDMSDFANFFSGVISSTRAPLAQLSAEALAAFDQLRGLSSATPQIDTSTLESTTESLQRMREEMGKVDAAASMPGISNLGKWALSMKADSDSVAVSYLEQKRQLLSLLDGYEAGTITVREFLEQAKAARNGMNLLNDSDLRQLESSIESARQRMQQLSEGSRDTLTSLREELAGLRGEQEAVDRSKFNSRKRDLQQQLADAQKGGDLNAVQNLMQALSTLQEIQRETDQQRQAAEQKARVDAQTAAAAPSAPPAPGQAPGGGFLPTQVIELRTPQGSSVRLGVESQQDATSLLDILSLAGQRTS